jgi:glycerol-3-phosphate dehydrogenase
MRLQKKRSLSAITRSFSASAAGNQIANRHELLQKLKSCGKDEPLDVLVVGGGATGCGAALDAALRGLKVACVEREDLSSGTSSRSTKLIWGGSRYLGQALVSLFNMDLRLFKKPIETIERFREEIRMVLNCHRERRFLLETQPHLTHWMPIAVPLTKWIVWPPPFNYPPLALGPLGLLPIFFKLYDALSGFTCPPSHLMFPQRARRKFPQLANNEIKYCSVFYEGKDILRIFINT